MPELDGHDWVDCALFLMFAHAHMTDWELSEEELEVIEKKTETFVSHITGEGEIFTELDVKEKMRIAFKWYDNSLGFSDEELLSEHKKVAGFLKDQDWFNPTFSQSMVDFLMELSEADGVVTENEKRSLNLLADFWDVNPPYKVQSTDIEKTEEKKAKDQSENAVPLIVTPGSKPVQNPEELPAWQKIKTAMESFGPDYEANYKEIMGYCEKHYGPIKKSTFRTYMISCTVNHNTRFHYHPNKNLRTHLGIDNDILYLKEKGKVVLYNPKSHGQWGVVENEYGKLGVQNLNT